MINGSIWEEDIWVENIYALNIGIPQCIQQILTVIKRETDSNTMIVRDFNTPLLSIDKWSRLKITKEMQVLNDT